MNIYVSFPITGQGDKIFEWSERYKDIVVMNGHIPVSPLDINDVTKENIKSKKWKDCLIKDLSILLDCDAILMCPGWESSKGCNLELCMARIYNKHIFVN